jgi:hypothetical protein
MAVPPKVTQLSNADATGAKERLSAMADPRTSKEASRPIQARRTKLAVLSIPSSVLDKGDPAYARTVRMANSYKKARIKELYIAHGYVSSGVSSLVAAEALALSASRFLFEYAAEHVLENPQLLKLASSLSDSARQNGLCAWELCAKEGAIRRRNDSANQASPWIVQSQSGGEKRGPGRPRKVNYLNPPPMPPEAVNAMVPAKPVEVVVSGDATGTDTDGTTEAGSPEGGPCVWESS